MTDRFEQQSQSLVDYAEPPMEPLKAHSLEETDRSGQSPDLGETLEEHNGGDLIGPSVLPLVEDETEAEAPEKARLPT